jgi:GDP-L-fucose synthase
LEQAHVIPALVRKFYEAVRENKNRVEVWGDGSAKRDFIHCADFTHLMVEAAMHYNGTMPMNLAYGEQHSVRDVAMLLTGISGFHGEIFWNTERPSGQHSREMSLQNLRHYLPGARPKIDLREGLSRTYTWLAENYTGCGIRL